MAAEQIPNLEDYLGMLENQAFNAHYDLDLSNATVIVLRPNGTGTHPASEMPTIFGEYRSKDDHFWFEPSMKFPEVLKDNEWLGNYHSHMEAWMEAAKLADYLLKSEWVMDQED